MGNATPEGSLKPFIVFLDENHCRNPHLRAAFKAAGIGFESYLDHFFPGVADTGWLPAVGARGWCLLTTDKRIRRRPLEREAVAENSICMFYFANNDVSGAEMGVTLSKALPRMLILFHTQTPPFIASINKAGEVKVRETFLDLD